ncbi:MULTISPECIES: hypothetical protein [Rothia]|uniref:Uncharacterized protein n=1 Tax=Rothia kristinae TaxID=37923 RepID=A0A199NSH3_9MICC|nr:hypothetical protein [Rothia kristinae]OAX51651.1 hypothetical protein AN277_0207550 [Rothia kristinae]QPT54471.1 hypothetical protein I6G21_04765 [Rothia kristinae]SQC36956.1 Uncharacterised protein [Rothia kristinae]
MSIPAYLAACAGLALGGFDPGPLLIAAVFMAARTAPDAARAVRRSVFGFGAVLIGGTIAWGIALSLVFGKSLADIPWGHWLRAGAGAAGVELLLGLVALGWAGWAWRRRNRPPRPERNRSSWGLLAVAVGFVAIVTTDPPFIVAVGLSGDQPLWAVIAGQIIWAVVSQAPLFVLCLAVLANRHRAVARTVGGWWERFRPVLNVLLPLGVGLLGLVLISDAAEYFALGRFLIDPRGVL